MTQMAAVVMAGGRGERFWPASTPERPKQFIDLTGNGTLIQQTVARVSQIIPLRQVYVVTGSAYVDLARTQLPRVPAQNVLVEPVGRDTAPCLGLAALLLERNDPDTVMISLPADHYIQDEDRFCDLVLDAAEAARQTDGIITFGICPDRPETGYGYIEMGQAARKTPHSTLYRVQAFVEKPNVETATHYLNSGRFMWNSGIFVATVGALRREIAAHLPALHEGLELINTANTRAEFDTLVELKFPQLPKISIDFGVMEHSQSVYMIPGDFGWDDLGSWTAVARLRRADASGNTLSGQVVTDNCRGLHVEAQSGRVVAALGLQDLVIVDTAEAVLVCAKEQAQNVRRLVQQAHELAHRGG